MQDQFSIIPIIYGHWQDRKNIVVIIHVVYNCSDIYCINVILIRHRAVGKG